MTFENPHSKKFKKGNGLADLINTGNKIINTIHDNKELINASIDTAMKTKDVVDQVIKAAKLKPKEKPQEILPIQIDKNIVNNVVSNSKKGRGFYDLN